jgi:hypothetical protein
MPSGQPAGRQRETRPSPVSHCIRSSRKAGNRLLSLLSLATITQPHPLEQMALIEGTLECYLCVVQHKRRNSGLWHCSGGNRGMKTKRKCMCKRVLISILAGTFLIAGGCLEGG